ncbi:hypothetical protein [Acinetobacter bereziniae]|uniref:hypothetical protein n=1 Tax=Acinetobacter bereziniae TaxID=106648 RepID=UPI003019AAF8
MKNETLLNQIKLDFRNVTLGNAYTLPEEDYADTSYWYFDKKRTDLNISEDQWNNQEIQFFETSGWLSPDIDEAILAIKDKRKMRNRFNNPFEIPNLYLNQYAVGFSFLKPMAYLFYTPAIMNSVLTDPDFNYGLRDPEVLNFNSFNSWLNRLSRSNTEDLITDLLKFFNAKQIELLIDFLHLALKLKSNSYLINEALNNIHLLKTNE